MRAFVPLEKLGTAVCLPLARGQVAVCVAVDSTYDAFVECMQSVLARTPHDVPLLVVEAPGADDRAFEFLEQSSAAGALEHHVYYVRHEAAGGPVAAINEAFARTAPADVAVVSSACLVTDGWLEAMLDAASSSTLVATVSVFTQPELSRSVADAARSIRSASLQLWPRVPTVLNGCYLVRRSAFELVGSFDADFKGRREASIDFAQRCVLAGHEHVVADDAFVGSALADPPGPDQVEQDRLISERYPYFYPWLERLTTDVTTPLERAVSATERALRGTSVTIDGRILTPIRTGTQLHTLELIAALSREGVALRVVLPDDLGEYARDVLARLPSVETLPASAVDDKTEPTDVVHRPFQVSSREDLDFLPRLGKRIVVTHQDLISYGNPGYFPEFESWQSYRRLTRYALSLADRVVFFSRTAADHALREELVERDRSEVVYIGTDHGLEDTRVAEKAPSGIAQLEDKPFLFCLGTDYEHKNRVFALRVLQALRARGWDGGLVFAGPHVPHGGSSAREASFLASHPDDARWVVDLAVVNESQKRWLLRNAALMVYPTVHEGFGLVPFEAAEAELACAFAPQTSMGELFPGSLALIEPWDANATADRILPYIDSSEARAAHARAVREVASRLTWTQTARRLLDVYAAAAADQIRESRALLRDFYVERRALEAHATTTAHELAELRSGYDALREIFDKTAEGLVGPNGVIPEDLRRPLLAIGQRPVLRGPLFALLRLGYTLGYRVRHGGRSP